MSRHTPNSKISILNPRDITWFHFHFDSLYLAVIAWDLLDELDELGTKIVQCDFFVRVEKMLLNISDIRAKLLSHVTASVTLNVILNVK